MTSQQHTSIESDGYHIPAVLKEYDAWVVWCPDLGKTARAPWQEGHMYPAEWAEDKPVDPRTTFNQASAAATLPIKEIKNHYPFPPDKDPQRVEPTILIPSSKSNNDLLFVDFDDVVSSNGRVSTEVWSILERLRGYTEISQSGGGLHVWVRGSLPEGYGKFIEPLDGPGQIEMYDRGRMTGCTWQHVAGTPKNDVPEQRDAVADLVERYKTKSCGCGTLTRVREIKDENPKCSGCGAEFDDNKADSAGRAENQSVRTLSGYGKKDNPYYQVDVTDVADTGAFRRHRNNWQGPHPSHGGTSSKDSTSTNFNVDRSENVWHCFAHGTGGGALSLIATLENIVSCRNVGRVHKDSETLLRACLAARDHAPALDGQTPPYDALIAVAKMADLPMENPDINKLGTAGHKFATQIYHSVDDYTELKNL